MRTADNRRDPSNDPRYRGNDVLLALLVLLIVIIFGLAGYAYFQVR